MARAARLEEITLFGLQRTPSRRASAAASTLLDVAVLRSTFVTWTLTVLSLMNRSRAISAFVRPATRWLSTSRSREVSVASALGGSGSFLLRRPVRLVEPDPGDRCQQQGLLDQGCGTQLQRGGMSLPKGFGDETSRGAF